MAQAGRKETTQPELQTGTSMDKSSGQIESGPVTLPGFKWWRAAANSLEQKSPEIFTASGAAAYQIQEPTIGTGSSPP